MVGLNISVGRQRVTSATSPYEANYVASIRQQFKIIMDNYVRVIEGLQKVTPEILYDALTPTFKLSQKYVPVDTGVLKDSGFLEIERRGKNPRVVIGYGKGGKPDYAGIVHERVDIPHKSPTKAQYLLDALVEDESGIQRRIITGYKKAFGNKGGKRAK